MADKIVFFKPIVRQKPFCYVSFFNKSSRGQEIRIAELIIRTLEVVDLHQTYIDQRIQNEMRFTKAYAQRFCELALGKFGVFFENPQCFQYIFV